MHALKIDRMFVAGLGADAGDAAIVDAVIGMAHGMARPVTAEGVEHEGHLAILKGLGCDDAQGYLLGRPGPLTDAVGEPPAWRSLTGVGEPAQLVAQRALDGVGHCRPVQRHDALGRERP